MALQEQTKIANSTSTIINPATIEEQQTGNTALADILVEATQSNAYLSSTIAQEATLQNIESSNNTISSNVNSIDLKTPNLGQTTMASSVPITMASDQTPIDVNLIGGDIQIGAVEIKNATDDTRVVVRSDGTENAMVVTQNSQPLPTGAATETTLLAVDGELVSLNSLVATEATSNNIFTTIGAQNDAAVTPGAVGSVQGKLRQISSDIVNLDTFQYRIAEGLLTDYIPVSVSGRNLDVDTAAEEDIWGVGGVWVPITSAQTVGIASTSASDTLAGTGARVVLVTGLDASGNTQTEVVNMNGVTTVTTTNTWIFIDQVEVVLSGTGQVNAGNITITASTDTTIQARITAGTGITDISFYQVPTGYTFYIDYVRTKISAGAGGTQVDVSIKYMGATTNTWTKPVIFRSRADGSAGDDFRLPRPYAFPEGTRVKFSASTTNNNTTVDIFYQGYLKLN